jgi:hypothetical protein
MVFSRSCSPGYAAKISCTPWLRSDVVLWRPCFFWREGLAHSPPCFINETYGPHGGSDSKIHQHSSWSSAPSKIEYTSLYISFKRIIHSCVIVLSPRSLMMSWTNLCIPYHHGPSSSQTKTLGESARLISVLNHIRIHDSSGLRRYMAPP